MSTASTVRRIDPLLVPFVHCSDERRAQVHLERLIRQYAEPVILKALQSLARSASKTYADINTGEGASQTIPDVVLPEADLHSEAVNRLLERISAIRYRSARPIGDLVMYIRQTVYYLFVQHFRDTRVERKFSSYGVEIETSGEDGDSISALIEQRGLLEAVWEEIRQLPENQRLALLCNFRDRDGANALPLLALCRIASKPELAKTLKVPGEELERLFDSRPMEDD